MLERGRAADPADRFATMAELLRALARDPAQRWRRALGVGGLAASAGAIAFALGQHAPGETDACEDGPEQLASAWHPAARAAALDRIATLGAYGRALQPQLARDLDVHARGWIREYRAACRDRRRGAESSALSDRRTLCLRRESDALAAVGALVEHATPANLPELPRAVQSIPDHHWVPESRADSMLSCAASGGAWRSRYRGTRC